MTDDSVQIRFGGDTADAEQAIDRVKSKESEVQDSTSQLREEFREFKEVMIEAFAVDQIAEFMSRMADLGEQAVRSAAMTGISVEKMQEFGFAAKMTGGNAEGMTTMIERLERNMADAQNPTTIAAKAFASLGISVTDASRKLKDADSILSQIADAFSKAPDGPDKTAIAMDLLGRSGAQMIPLLDQGSEGLKQMGVVADQTGSILTKLQAEGFEASHQQLVILKASIEGVQVALFDEMRPAVDGASQGLAHFFEELSQDVSQGGVFHEVIVQLVDVFEVFVGVLETLATALGTVGALAHEALTGNFSEMGDVVAEAGNKIKTQWADIDKIVQKVNEDVQQARKETALAESASIQAQTESLHAPSTGGAGTNSPDHSGDLVDIDAEAAIAQQRLQQQKDIYQQFVDMGILSKQQALENDKQAAEEEYQIQLDALNKKLELYNTDSDADVANYNRTLEQIDVLAEKHNTDMQKLDLEEAAAHEQAVKQTTKTYTEFFNTIDRSMDEMLKGVLTGTQTWQQAMAKLFDNLALSFIEDVAKMMLKWAAFTVAQNILPKGSSITAGLATQVPSALGGTSASGGGVTGAMLTALTTAFGLSTTATLSAAQINALCTTSTDANTGAVVLNATSTNLNTTTQGTGIVAWGANTLATLANTVATKSGSIGKLFSFDVGTPSLPFSGPIMAHKGEMILPPDISAAVRSGNTTIGAGPLGAGGATSTSAGGTNISVTALDSKSVVALFNNPSIMRQLAKNMGAYQSNNPSVRGNY